MKNQLNITDQLEWASVCICTLIFYVQFYVQFRKAHKYQRPRLGTLANSQEI